MHIVARLVPFAVLKKVVAVLYLLREEVFPKELPDLLTIVLFGLDWRWEMKQKKYSMQCMATTGV